MSDTDEEIRRTVVGALGNIVDPRVEPALEAALKDSSKSVRREAADNLGYIGDPRAVPLLLAVLDDPQAEVRSGAAYALGLVADSRAAAPLVERLTSDSDKNVRSSTAGALGEIGDPQALPALLQAQKDPIRDVRPRRWGRWATWATAGRRCLLLPAQDADDDLRGAAITSLGRINGARALPLLLAALKDPKGSVRVDAAEALGDLGDPRAVEGLAAALGDRLENVRFWAAIALGTCGNAPAGRNPTAGEGSKAGDALLPLLEGKDDRVKVVAAFALGLLRRPEALPHLADMLRKRDDWQAFAAVAGLARLDTPEARAALQEGAEKARDAATRRFAARAAEKGLAAALEAELAEPPRNSHSYYAARVLLFLNDPSTLPALRQARPAATIQPASGPAPPSAASSGYPSRDRKAAVPCAQPGLYSRIGSRMGSSFSLPGGFCGGAVGDGAVVPVAAGPPPGGGVGLAGFDGAQADTRHTAAPRTIETMHLMAFIS